MGYREIPRCTLTGLPLPMWYDDSFSHYEGRPAAQQRKDEHHTFFPRRELEAGPLEDLALRVSRVQRGPRWDHDLFHAIYGTPVLPATELRQFGVIVLAASGYIPDRAISFNKAGVPRTVKLDPEQREKLWSPNGIHIEHPATVRKYLLQYVIQHGLNVDVATIDEFLHTDKVEDRMVIGECMIEQASAEATRPYQEVYSEAHRYRRLPKHQPEAIGACVFQLVAKDEQGGIDYQAMAWLDEIFAAQAA